MFVIINKLLYIFLVICVVCWIILLWMYVLVFILFFEFGILKNIMVCMFKL